MGLLYVVFSTDHDSRPGHIRGLLPSSGSATNWASVDSLLHVDDDTSLI